MVLAATGSITAGYFTGGYGNSGARSLCDKCTYSTDSTAQVPAAELSNGRYYLAATGNRSAGYFGGGEPSSGLSVVDKLTYSTDTTARA